ncbi:unnamed protein product [Toxocara canis]|uniref:CG-1 domain-containing protein n=1 Tax=Toxocara canis TaxID=6265 RepID=A0A183UE19_TOXCA|nr:unnamed protein product [Toxocara canis]
MFGMVRTGRIPFGMVTTGRIPFDMVRTGIEPFIREVARILYSAQDHPEWISSEVRTFPPSTSQKLFKRLDGLHFKQDGYEWKRRKEGKLIREDHVKLKVQKLETIAGSYVHSAIVPSFHRRTYWLFDQPEIVLVHYLNVTSEETRDGQPLHIRIAQSVRSSGLSLKRSQLEQQIRPILCYSMHPAEIGSLLANVDAVLNSTHSLPPAVTCRHRSEQQVSYVGDCGMEGVEVVHLEDSSHNSQSEHYPLERSNSCSGAFRRGLSSLAMRRQLSAFSDTVDQHFTGSVLANYTVESDSSLLNTEKMTTVPSGYADFACHRDANGLSKSPATVIEPDSGSSGCSASENRAVLSQAGNASQPDTSCPPPLIEIADLSPDRSPLKGGTKVLIVGGWYLRGHDYSVMFGDQQVPATLFHAGVLRCFAPPRSAGVVKLEVYCDGLLISHAVQFEYVDMSAAGGRSAVLAELGQRLSFVHSCLLTEGVDCMRELPETDAEAVVLEICNEMIQYPFNYSLLTSPPLEYNGNSLLHLCAMLNYHRTIRLLLQWRSEISSRFYMRDLDVVARDAEGRTPLHIAITHANLYTIQVLISHCPSSIDVLDDRGETPQDLVVKSRNMHIANTVKQSVEAVRQLNNKVVDERCTLSKESVNSTALWVMTNGETVTDEQRLARSSMLSSSSCLPQTRENRSPDKSLNGSSEFLDPNSANSNGSCDSSNEHHRVVHVGFIFANSERSSWMDDPLSMDVHIPDSPTTAGMWSALTSNDDAASEEARARMANLAQQIIDALPARIKGSSTAVESNCLDDVGGLSEPSSSGLSGHSKNPFIGNAYVGSSSEWEELISPLDASNYGFTSPSSFMERTEDEAAAGEVGPLDVLNASPSPSTFSALHSASVRQSNTVEGAVGRRSPNTTDLGEFFNAEGVMGPLERHFRDLRLSVRADEYLTGMRVVIHPCAALIDVNHRIVYSSNLPPSPPEAPKAGSEWPQSFHYFLAAETEIPVNKSNYYLKRLSMLVFSNPCSKHFATKEVDKVLYYFLATI